MDWIDELLDKIRRKFLTVHLRKTMILSMIVAIIVVIVAYLFTVSFCESWITLIYDKYKIDIDHLGSIHIAKFSISNRTERLMLFLLENIKQYCIVFYSLIAIILTANWFYKNKIDEPLKILLEEVEYIGKNDLSISCYYNSEDEMGKICKAVEEMRKQLILNQQSVWNVVESQKQLNAAFAHDLRTPLTVMQGYIDLLLKYHSSGKISEEKLEEILTLLQNQVLRLKSFSQTMKGLNQFDDIKLNEKQIKVSEFHREISEILMGLQEQNIVMIEYSDWIKEEIITVDEKVVLQVLNNLLSNALSFAKEKIEVTSAVENGFLSFYIKDDGAGFDDTEIYMATKPYYSSRKENTEHFGIGLSICKQLCEKHGGELVIGNSIEGGALVLASFRLKEK